MEKRLFLEQNDDDNGSDTGSVYVYQLGEDGSWNQTVKITAHDGNNQDKLGHEVGISDNTIVTGTYKDVDSKINQARLILMIYRFYLLEKYDGEIHRIMHYQMAC